MQFFNIIGSKVLSYMERDSVAYILMPKGYKLVLPDIDVYKSPNAKMLDFDAVFRLGQLNSLSIFDNPNQRQ